MGTGQRLLMLFGVFMCAAFLREGLRSGHMPFMRSSVVTRARHPVVFWTLAAVYAVIALAGMYFAIV